MNQARREILARVRANRPSAVELPTLECPWQTFADPLEQFRAVLSSLGAQSEVLADRPAANAWLSAYKDYAKRAPRISLIEGVGQSDLGLNDLSRPHELAQLEYAVLPGEFGVAENGAIWITDQEIRHRAVYFLCEHLVLVLSVGRVVNNMHEAYQQIPGFGQDQRPPYGTFIAGPSKTADIEQSLVIGAQGPRSLAVLLLEAY